MEVYYYLVTFFCLSDESACHLIKLETNICNVIFGTWYFWLFDLLIEIDQNSKFYLFFSALLLITKNKKSKSKSKRESDAHTIFWLRPTTIVTIIQPSKIQFQCIFSTLLTLLLPLLTVSSLQFPTISLQLSHLFHDFRLFISDSSSCAFSSF